MFDYRIFQTRRSIDRKESSHADERCHSILERTVQTNGSWCLEPNFLARSILQNAWKSFHVGVTLVYGQRISPCLVASFYIHYIMMFIVVPTGTIVPKVNI